MTSKSTGYIKNNLLTLSVAVVIFLAVCILETLFVKEEYISRTLADVSKDTDSLELLPALQSFVPQYGKIKSVAIDIGKKSGQANSGVLTLTLYNQALDTIDEKRVDVAQMKDSGLTEIATDWKVSKGQVYFVGVSCEGCEVAPVLHYRSKSHNAPEENLDFYYGPTVVEDATANISYTYLKMPGVVKLIFLHSATAFLMILAAGLFRKNEER